MKGPGLRIDLDVRRVWRCPACGRELRLGGGVTAVLCDCRRSDPPRMQLVESRRGVVNRFDYAATRDRWAARPPREAEPEGRPPPGRPVLAGNGIPVGDGIPPGRGRARGRNAAARDADLGHSGSRRQPPSDRAGRHGRQVASGGRRRICARRRPTAPQAAGPSRGPQPRRRRPRLSARLAEPESVSRTPTVRERAGSPRESQREMTRSLTAGVRICP